MRRRGYEINKEKSKKKEYMKEKWKISGMNKKEF